MENIYYKRIFGSKNVARFMDIVVEVPPQSVVESLCSTIDRLHQTCHQSPWNDSTLNISIQKTPQF